VCLTHWFNLVIIIAKKNTDSDEIVANWESQLRKGVLELAILSYIRKNCEQAYGYELIKKLKLEGIPVEGNTIYPIVRRLEKNGIIISKWTTDTNQPKKYFQITEMGDKVFDLIQSEWNDFFQKINHFIETGGLEQEDSK